MKTLFSLNTSLIVAALLSLPMAQAATISKDEYKTTKDRISADYKADKKACDAMEGNAKDICVQEAKAKEKIAKAELQYSHSGKPVDQRKIIEAKADGAYEVAKEKCDDLKGNDKDVCMQEAKAAKTKALADAKMNTDIRDAKKDAANDRRDADYKVAAEKCDAMAGEAKTQCIANAKARYGKS
jgi:hypothetical protein